MGTRLYVGNLPYGMGEAELRTLFEEEGRKVVDVRLISDRVTGQARGFGFVEMGTDADALSAIQSLHGRSVQGRSMVVNEARDREPGGRPPGAGPGMGGPRPPFRSGPPGDRPGPRVDRIGPPGAGGGGGGYQGARPGGGGGFGGPRPGGGFGGPRPGGGPGGGFGGPPGPGFGKGTGERRRDKAREGKKVEDTERDKRGGGGAGRRRVDDQDWRQDVADSDTTDAPAESDYSGDEGDE